MKTLFVEARKKTKSLVNIEELNRLPEKIHILYTIQYKTLAEAVKKKLGKSVVAFEQVIGCSKVKPKSSLLLIGSGRFHALQLLSTTSKPIYMYNNKLEKLDEKEILKLKALEKGKLARFFSSSNIGILFSIKPGQSKLKFQEKIKQLLARKFKNKKFYSFVSDSINISELENFPVDFWINTACPGIELDSTKIINYDKIQKK